MSNNGELTLGYATGSIRLLRLSIFRLVVAIGRLVGRSPSTDDVQARVGVVIELGVVGARVGLWVQVSFSTSRLGGGRLYVPREFVSLTTMVRSVSKEVHSCCVVEVGANGEIVGIYTWFTHMFYTLELATVKCLP